MVKLYSENFERNFYARKCSWTYLFFVLVIVSVLFMPFIFAFATNNFWSPNRVYYGRPNIKFTNEVFMQAEVGGQIKSYSNKNSVNQQIRDKLDGVLFKAIERDSDDNRIAENFQFDLSFKTGGGAVSSIVIMLHFTYFIENVIYTTIEGMVPVFITSPSGSSISRAQLTGQIKLDQKAGLIIGNDYVNTLYNYNFTEEVSKYSIGSIYERYTDRNITFEYDHTALVMPYGESDTTHIKLEMNVPEYTDILYYPGYFESLKLAWVQYYALLVPIYLLLFIGLVGKTVESDVFPTVMTKDCTTSLKVIE